ncbi:hypothetical protein B0H14DRAFT_3700399 [Mycena olivaceomarginata]|nr:hypothetical protein B0H14DRAFT_3700399 [Mycena olivaceomarginata]
MLLIFILIHLFSKNRGTVQGHALDPRGPADSCDDIHRCRTLFSIVLGCLTTIFVCTWVSIHPNVPPPNQGRIALLARRLRLMLVGIIAPELMVGFAARQFWGARSFSTEFNVSRTHGYFFCMGGFVSRSGHPVATLDQLRDPLLGAKYLHDIKNIKEEDIADKSERDAFSKGVALVQGLWFTIQCLARVTQRLPVTELEVATLAFAVIDVFIWLLWWGKPLNVQRPIPVGPAFEAEEAEPETQHLGLLTTFFGLLNGEYSEVNPVSSASVPTFWSMDNDGESVYNPNMLFVIECLVGTVFGTIHWAAWKTDFPSAAEMRMWRSSALLVTAIPGVLGCSLVAYEFAVNDSIAETVFTAIAAFIAVPGIPIYILSRLVLIIVSFTTLRALPPGAFIDVDWSIYIPHV